jgi:imidazoleglycerol-phosphate dehydratase
MRIKQNLIDRIVVLKVEFQLNVDYYQRPIQLIFRISSMSDRVAKVTRDTLETQIKVSINLDGTGQSSLETGIPFLDHMLDQVARHGLVDLEISARGDRHIDDHHTVEDIGITLGQAFTQALGDKKGLVRYGHAYVPLDEALSRVVIDFSGRPGIEYRVEYPRARIGQFDVDLIHEFFQGFANHASATLHIDNLFGKNAHHIAETVFKAFGRALRVAVSRDERMSGVIPSTKGSL